MAKKPFIVSVELEIGIMAESEEEIRNNFSLSEMFRDEISNGGIHGTDMTIRPFNRLPDGWDENCILYGDRENEVTAQQALEMKE